MVKYCPSCGVNIDTFLLKKDDSQKADKNKESVKFWYNRGVDFSHSNDYEKALDSYDKALTFDDTDPDIWNNKCYVLTKLGRYEEAIKAGNKGIELAPNDPQIWDCLRDAYLANNNLEKAAECSKKITRLENAFIPIEKLDLKMMHLTHQLLQRYIHHYLT